MVSRFKVIVLVLLSSVILFAEEQREIESKSDFEDFKKTMLTATQFEPKKSYYALGLLFSNNIPLKNGKFIQADLQTSKEYFYKAFDAGNLMSAYNIAMIDVVNKEYDSAVHILQQGLSKIDVDKSEDISTGSFLSSTLAGVVLDKMPKNQEAMQMSIDYLLPYVEKQKLATAEYLLSNLYMATNQRKEADNFLNRACTNQRAPKEIVVICHNANNIEVSKNE